MRLDVGEVLPVTSSRSSEMRQAATPTHTVSIRDVTSRSIKENWLNAFSPQTRIEKEETSTVCRVGKCSEADLKRFCGGLWSTEGWSCDAR